MGWLSIGDTLSVLKLLATALQHRQFRAIYWSARRRFSAERLRQQTRLVHQDLAHNARDIVAERLEFWAEAERNVEIIERSIDHRLTPTDPTPENIEQVDPVRLESEQMHLDEFVSQTRIAVDEFLSNSCQALSKYLSAWMPEECHISIHILLEAQTVVRSEQFERYTKSDLFKHDASRFLESVGRQGPHPNSTITVSCVRSRCVSSNNRNSTYFPWRVVDETTVFKSLMDANRNDPDGHDHLFQCHDTSLKKRHGGAPYKDPLQESHLYKSVVAVPVRSFSLAHNATLGFVWLDAPKPYVFLSMFQHDPNPQKRTAGLHLLHAFGDTVATVLACERNVIRGACHAKSRLAAGTAKLAGLS